MIRRQLGCRVLSLRPSLGTQRHLHTFRLARCSPFRPPRFQLLIWKRKKKPARRGGNPSCCPHPRPPAPELGVHEAPPPPCPAPPLPVCSAHARRRAVAAALPWGEGTPWSERAERLRWRGVLQEPLLLPRNRARCQPPVSTNEPKPYKGFIGSESCLLAAGPGIVNPIRWREKLSPREGQFTSSRPNRKGGAVSGPIYAAFVFFRR